MPGRYCSGLGMWIENAFKREQMKEPALQACTLRCMTRETESYHHAAINA